MFILWDGSAGGGDERAGRRPCLGVKDGGAAGLRRPLGQEIQYLVAGRWPGRDRPDGRSEH